MRTTRRLGSAFTLTSILFASTAAFGQDGASGTLDSVAPPQDNSAQAASPQPAQAPAAHAQTQPQPDAVVYDPAGIGFGKAGQFAISAERMFGVAWESESTDVNGIENTDSYTGISVLSSRISGAVGNFSFVRLAADYFVTNGLSLGASLGYFNLSGHSEQSANGVTAGNDTGGVRGFHFAPRVGYAAMFSPTVGIWPKAGVSYVSATGFNADGDDLGGSNRTALSLETPLVISPVQHAGFSVGPSLDYGIAGTDDDVDTDPTTGASRTTSVDVSTIALGLHAGVFIYF